jgi:hypothetical protein
MNLIERAEATQKTVDAFKRKEFNWGTFDCVQLAVTHARHVGKKIRVPKYGDALSAKKALKKVGYELLSEAMDKHFKRILPHMAMMGDFIEMPGHGDGFSSLAVIVGNGRIIGFYAEIPHADILEPVLISGAWSVE